MKKLLILMLLCGLAVCEVSAKKKLKTNYRNTLVYAYSQSVVEDDNLKLEIYDGTLYAINKTKETIFLDLSQCFVNINGTSYPMYEETQVKKKAAKKGIVTSADVFITISPSLGEKQNEVAICSLGLTAWGKYTTSETPLGTIDDKSRQLFAVINELTEKSKSEDPKGKQYLGTATRHLTEDESFQNIAVSIAYAFNKKAEKWTNCQLSTWVSDVIFAPFYVELPEDLKRKDKKGFAVKEQKPAVIHVKAENPFEFESDKSPIMLADWEGDYKKGTFTLQSAKPAKSDKSFGSIFKAMLHSYAFGGPLTLDSKYYKSIIQFDGTNVDWGEMTYAKSVKDAVQEN